MRDAWPRLPSPPVATFGCPWGSLRASAWGPHRHVVRPSPPDPAQRRPLPPCNGYPSSRCARENVPVPGRDVEAVTDEHHGASSEVSPDLVMETLADVLASHAFVCLAASTRLPGVRRHRDPGRPKRPTQGANRGPRCAVAFVGLRRTFRLVRTRLRGTCPLCAKRLLHLKWPAPCGSHRSSKGDVRPHLQLRGSFPARTVRPQSFSGEQGTGSRRRRIHGFRR